MRAAAAQQLPFELRVHNLVTRDAMAEAESILSKRTSPPRTADYAKAFLKGWERLTRAGRFDMNWLKRLG